MVKPTFPEILSNKGEAQISLGGGKRIGLWVGSGKVKMATGEIMSGEGMEGESMGRSNWNWRTFVGQYENLEP